MMLATGNRVKRLNGSEEVTRQISKISSTRTHCLPWDELGTLVDKLVEGMLAVGTALSPDNWL
jgi:hypothetical protein